MIRVLEAHAMTAIVFLFMDSSMASCVSCAVSSSSRNCVSPSCAKRQQHAVMLTNSPIFEHQQKEDPALPRQCKAAGGAEQRQWRRTCVRPAERPPMLSSCTPVYMRNVYDTVRQAKAAASKMQDRHGQRTGHGTWTVGSMSSIPPAPSKPPPEVPPDRGEELQRT